MKRLTLALGLAALVLTAVPLCAAVRRSGRTVTAAHRPHGHPSHGRHSRGSVYWGWGWGWGAPYWYGAYWYRPWYGPYYGPSYGRYSAYGTPPNWAVVDTDVSPERARVYLDGQFIGTADDFDGYPDYLYLKRGRYRLEFRLDGYQTREISVDARPGVKIDVDDKLAKIPGAPRYGSYETEEPPGGVRRFFAKRRDAAQAVEEDEIYGAPPPRYSERPRETEEPDRSAEEPEREAEPGEERGTRDEWRERASPERDDTWLAIAVRPDDAAIYLDDRFIGTAAELGSERGIAVAPGRHILTISRPGYRDRRVEVEVSRGETEKVEVTLER